MATGGIIHNMDPVCQKYLKYFYYSTSSCIGLLRATSNESRPCKEEDGGDDDVLRTAVRVVVLYYTIVVVLYLLLSFIIDIIMRNERKYNTGAMPEMDAIPTHYYTPTTSTLSLTLYAKEAAAVVAA
jgi:hypothetical protein